MDMNAALAGLLTAMVIGGLAMVVAGAVPAARPPRGEKLSTGMSTQLWTAVEKRWRSAPRGRRIRWTAGLAAGLVGYLVTGWAILLVLGPALLIGLPMLLSDPPERDLDMVRGLERWVRLVAGSASTGKSVVDAIRATRRQAPEILAEPLAGLVGRLDARWEPRAAFQRLADDLDSADADQVIAAILIASQRGGTGASATLTALAGGLADRAKAMREIATERAKPRIVVRQVTGIIGVVLGVALIFGRSYFTPYASLLGQGLLCLYAAMYTGALAVLARRSRMRRRDRILVGAGPGGPVSGTRGTP